MHPWLTILTDLLFPPTTGDRRDLTSRDAAAALAMLAAVVGVLFLLT